MNKRLVGWILLCWLVGGLYLVFPNQVAVGWEFVQKILDQSAPEWSDYPDFRASGESIPKGFSHFSMGGGRREKATGFPGPSRLAPASASTPSRRREKATGFPRPSRLAPASASTPSRRREKATGFPGPSPRRSGPSGRDQPRRSSDTHAAGSSHISFFRPRIIDGDTIRHKRRKIRLNGIDAPERDQPYGSEATRALARKLRRGKVTCRLEGKEGYGRHLGTCYVKGENVNEWMVRNGYAWSYWTPRYRRQEELAQRERKGVHRSRSAIRPEQWRRRRG